MSTSAIELKKLQSQIKELQKRVAKLEAAGRRNQPARKNTAHPFKSNIELIALLKSRGLVGEPTKEEKRLASEWRALAPGEQDNVMRTLREIRLKQPIAELIAELRS